MNYFVEGIQGSGKSTLVRKLLQDHPGTKAFREGDYSPIELAWCAYVDEKTYQEILLRYAPIADEIRKKSFSEGDHYVICYIQILTDLPGFHKDLERYEIYNGNLSLPAFTELVTGRFLRWDGFCGDGGCQIFECSFFQNTIDDLLLFYEQRDEDVLSFYRQIRKALEGKEYEIIYLEVDDIQRAEEKIRKERCDASGNEMWFPLMTRFLENSPYGKRKKLTGMEGLAGYLTHRANLEKRILGEIFPDKYTLIKRSV